MYGAHGSAGIYRCPLPQRLVRRAAESTAIFIPFAEQGITTQVVGNCGFAPFGYDPGTPYKNLLGSGLFQVGDAQGDFSTFAGWCDSAAKLTPLNMVPLQGHGPIRIGICGYENRPLTGQEMKKRDEILERSLSDGAFGASFGLMYEPDRYATADELEGAARIVAKHGGVLTVHERLVPPLPPPTIRPLEAGRTICGHWMK